MMDGCGCPQSRPGMPMQGMPMQGMPMQDMPQGMPMRRMTMPGAQDPMMRLTQANFTLLDTKLFLDTHPTDRQALDFYQ